MLKLKIIIHENNKKQHINCMSEQVEVQHKTMSNQLAIIVPSSWEFVLLLEGLPLWTRISRKKSALINFVTKTLKFRNP